MRPLPEEHILQLRTAGLGPVELTCTAQALPELITGRLYSEGLIQAAEDISALELSPDGSLAQVTLCRPAGAPVPPKSAYRPLARRFPMAYIQDGARRMRELAVQYAASGGMHSSALFDGENLLSFYEDIARRNTLDKIAGDCLLRGLAPMDTLLITSGRVNMDMVQRAARLGASVIASFSALTAGACDLAEAANMTVVAYLGRPSMCVYGRAERIPPV